MKSNRIAASAAAVVVAIAGQAMAQVQGPSSSATPYVVPVAPGVVTKSLVTVGDSIAGYRMVGIPDGMGAIDNGDGTYNLLVNHELGATAGVTRAHGSRGAFVSEWRIEKASGAVLSGRDLITGVVQFDRASGRSSAGRRRSGACARRTCPRFRRSTTRSAGRARPSGST